MAPRTGRKARPPLDAAKLDELALAYVGRFATTKARLSSYLSRKLRERGWAGDRSADVEGIVERLAGLGYVDDAAYALSKSRALSSRGYGLRRVNDSLRSAGIDDEDAVPAREFAETEAVAAALRFAQRRRFGPYGDRRRDGPERERALAAMIRAGHSFALAKAILSLEPGSTVDMDLLAQSG